MIYFESAEGIMISFERTVKELYDHGVVDGSDDFQEFFENRGCESFPMPAQDLLLWLGY